MYIFLDIDGVLCTPRQAAAEGDYGLLGCLDPVAIKFLDRMCAEYDIKIVISSTWRIGKDSIYFDKIFKAAGAYNLAKHLAEPFGTPPPSSGFRGEEIQEYIDSNNVNQYIIIDDEDDFFGYQLSHLIKTDYQNGLTFDNYINY